MIAKDRPHNLTIPAGRRLNRANNRFHNDELTAVTAAVRRAIETD